MRQRIEIGSFQACAQDAPGLLTCWGMPTEDAADGEAAPPAQAVADYDLENGTAIAILPGEPLWWWGTGMQWVPDAPPRAAPSKRSGSVASMAAVSTKPVRGGAGAGMHLATLSRRSPLAPSSMWSRRGSPVARSISPVPSPAGGPWASGGPRRITGRRSPRPGRATLILGESTPAEVSFPFDVEDYDTWVGKLDDSGLFQCAWAAYGNQNETCTDAFVDPEGGVIAIGNWFATQNELILERGEPEETRLVGTISYDGFIVRYAPVSAAPVP